MEISLEKIELVKDRTGVSYREAKDALIQMDGSIVDAIIYIENEMDGVSDTKMENDAAQLLEAVKDLVKKGNVTKIVIKKGNTVVLNIPVNVGIIGALWAFWPTVAATILALGTKCSIGLVKENGEEILLNEKAAETMEDVREGCSMMAEDLMEKSGGIVSQVCGKAIDMLNRVKQQMEEPEEPSFSDEISEEENEPSDDAKEDIVEGTPAEEEKDEPDEEFPDGKQENEEETQGTVMEDETVSSVLEEEEEQDYFDDDDYFNFDDYEELEETDVNVPVKENRSEEGNSFETEKTEAANASEDSFSEDAREEIEKAGAKFEKTIAQYKKLKSRLKRD